MSKIPVSVGILTFNSVATLERALRSVEQFADIIICDGGSTDDTLAIAARFGARIIEQNVQFKNTNGSLRDFGGVRNQCLEAARYDWFLYIDSDESISDGLRDEVAIVASAPIHADDPLVYRVPIRNIMDGHLIQHASNYPGYQHRFFNRKSGAHFIKPVHERIAFDTASVRVGTLLSPWYVYSTREESRHYLRETAKYRSLEISAAMDRPMGEFFRYVVYRGLRTSLGVLLKSSYNYARYGFKESASVHDEWGRFASPLLVIWGILIARLKRKTRHLFLSHQRLPEPELGVVRILLEDHPGVFLDVGASVGPFITAALPVRDSEAIFAFEPNLQYAMALRGKFPKVHVEQLAVSSSDGVSRLKIPTIKGVQYLTRGTLEKFTEEGESGAEYVDVHTITLDSYCSEHSLLVSVIKIDVEGHEKEVIAGARSLLLVQHPAIIIEIEQRHHTEPVRNIFSYLEVFGYEGWFFDIRQKKYVSIADFSAEVHQSLKQFKTLGYVNNFVFLRRGSTAPTF